MSEEIKRELKYIQQSLNDTIARIEEEQYCDAIYSADDIQDSTQTLLEYLHEITEGDC